MKKKKESLINFERNQRVLTEVNQILSDGDRNIQSLLSTTIRQLESTHVNSNLTDRLVNICNEVSDVSYELSKLRDINNVEDNLDQIVDRLDVYQRLKRKFNTDTEGLANVHLQYQNELEQIHSIDENILFLHKSIADQSENCFNMANKLHDARLKSAKKLSKDLTIVVHKMNMNGATINIKVERNESLLNTGLTKLTFCAETNPGEGLHPIKDIASGGELSRILLALRYVLSQTNSISIFLFDEIDTGIGGETAKTIGSVLKDVSRSSQVIAITHLPQIACFADQLISVEKETISSTNENRTISAVKHVGKKDISPYIEVMQGLS